MNTLSTEYHCKRATACYNKKMSKTKKRKPTKEESDAFALVGRIGGTATFKKIGRKGMKELGKLGAKKRWNNEA